MCIVTQGYLLGSLQDQWWEGLQWLSVCCRRAMESSRCSVQEDESHMDRETKDASLIQLQELKSSQESYPCESEWKAEETGALETNIQRTQQQKMHPLKETSTLQKESHFLFFFSYSIHATSSLIGPTHSQLNWHTVIHR